MLMILILFFVLLGIVTVKLGKVEYTKDELLDHILTAKNLCAGIKFQPNDFLSDLLTTVPLFVNDADQYKWNHKSIQEYFAALFIRMDAKRNQSEILEKMIQSNSYQYLNVLDLYYDLDYRSFRNTIIYKLVCEYIKYFESSYQSNYDINVEAVNLRKSFTFGRHIVYFSRSAILALVGDQTQETDLFVNKNPFDPLVNWSVENNTFADNALLRSGSIEGDSDSARLIFSAGVLSVVSILVDKEEDIFTYAEQAILFRNVLQFSDSVRNPRSSNSYRSFLNTTDQPIIISDDPDLAINSKKFFNEVTANIALTANQVFKNNKRFFYILDYFRCVAMKNSIEEDLQLEKTTSWTF